ncbi:ABC transporter substrate-binding protein [Micromonospora sp. NPDC003776]
MIIEATTAERVAAEPDVLHFTGPAPAGRLDRPGDLGTGQVLRLLTRQLFAYPAARGPVGPIADAAVELPTVTNGDVRDGGRTVRIRLRSGIFWDAQAAREITAGDFVRGIKRTAHPDARPVRPVFAAMIEGLAEYYEAYDEAFGHWDPHAPAFAQFQRHTPVPGLLVENDKTLVVRLTAAHDGVLDLLATGYSAAAPREYDYYVPDSPELYRCCPSAGPYRIVRRLSPGGDFALEPNPRWDPATDPIRRRPTARIELSLQPRAAAGGPGAAWFGVLGWESPPSVDAWAGAAPAAEYTLVPTGRRAVPGERVDRSGLAAALLACGAVTATDAGPDTIGAGSTSHLALVNPAGSRLAPLVEALIVGCRRQGLELTEVARGADADVVLRERIASWPVELPGADRPGPDEVPLATAVWPRAIADARTGGAARWS